MAEGVGAAKSILRKHGSYNWLTEKGNLVILDNDAEFALLLVVLGG
jgi:putative oxidoreductase